VDVEEGVELLVEVLDGERAERVQVAADLDPIVGVRMGTSAGGNQEVAGGGTGRRRGAISWSAAFAGVMSTAGGIQTAATVVARRSFQPWTQPYRPDLVRWATASIEVCGATPGSRCFLGQTPPRAWSPVLSIAAAGPRSSHGCGRVTR
jgi:hypothetical protein